MHATKTKYEKKKIKSKQETEEICWERCITSCNSQIINWSFLNGLILAEINDSQQTSLKKNRPLAIVHTE